jgi:hypothetical protein
MLKLSYRDKVIAIIVTVILLIAAGWVFIVNPQIDKYQAKQLEVQAKEDEKATVEAKIETLDDIQMNIIRTAYNIGDLQEPFFLEEYHYQLEQLFHQYVDESGLEINDITFSVETEEITASQYMPSYNILAYAMKMNADLYGVLPEDVVNLYNEVKLEEKPVVDIGIFKIEVTFGDILIWDELRPFIDVIAELDRTILINTTEPEVIPDLDGNATEDPTITATLTLYTIVPMDRDTVVENELDVAEANGGPTERQALEDFIEILEEEAREREESNQDEENAEPEQTEE